MKNWCKKKWTQIKAVLGIRQEPEKSKSRKSSSQYSGADAVGDIAEIAVDVALHVPRGAARTTGTVFKSGGGGDFGGGGASGDWGDAAEVAVRGGGSAAHTALRAGTIVSVADASPAFADAATPVVEAASSGFGETLSAMGDGIGEAAAVTGEFLANAASVTVDVAGSAAEVVGSVAGAALEVVGDIASGL